MRHLVILFLVLGAQELDSASPHDSMAANASSTERPMHMGNHHSHDMQTDPIATSADSHHHGGNGKSEDMSTNTNAHDDHGSMDNGDHSSHSGGTTV